MSVRLDLEVRLSDIPRWDGLFRVLAMERWRPFLAAMGLPAPIWERPDALGGCARTYLDERNSMGALASDSVVMYLSRQSDLLQATFDCIAAAYGKEVADEFVAWSRRMIIDSESSTRLFVWGAALRMLCTKVADSAVCPPPDAGLVERLCPELRARLAPAEMREIRTRLSAARGAPATAFESQLNAEVLHAAGDDPNPMNAVELAAELVESTIRADQTWRAWQAVARRMAPGDDERLLGWARCRVMEEGMPAPDRLPDGPGSASNPA